MKTRNFFAAVVLTACISVSASAGYMQTDSPSPAADPTPTPPATATGTATTGSESTTQQTAADGTSATLTEVVIALIQSSLLPLF
jgi:hypothetical protein